MARLKRCVLPVVRKAQELALFLGNATVTPVHPFEGRGDEECGGRTPAFSRQASELAALPHAGMRLVETARAEAELSRYEPEALPDEL